MLINPRLYWDVQVDTSGDTGPAAIAAVRGCNSLDITVLYPYQRVSADSQMSLIIFKHDV
jgi:threonine synthase